MGNARALAAQHPTDRFVRARKKKPLPNVVVGFILPFLSLSPSLPFPLPPSLCLLQRGGRPPDEELRFLAVEHGALSVLTGFAGFEG